jgi:hypothetical protein
MTVSGVVSCCADVDVEHVNIHGYFVIRPVGRRKAQNVARRGAPSWHMCYCRRRCFCAVRMCALVSLSMAAYMFESQDVCSRILSPMHLYCLSLLGTGRSCNCR